ncbi:hypothetical protein EJD97_011279 [Solanum chilense]|uniref:Uncharacterized protein n=1 Tax=Solanum chilense TaxID=4083 RepID=A0A6N2CBM4_SOLCI|nr:hypothetical protein EJD97_011279 [Solanum chilense]
MVFGTIKILGDPQMPLANTGDEVRVTKTGDTEFEVETDKEILEKFGEAAHEGFTENEEVMVDVVVQASTPSTPFAAPSTTGTS